MTAQPVLSDLQQKAVWEGWLSSEIRANYFADLAYRFARAQKICNWSMLVISSGAFYSAAKEVGHEVVVGLTLAGAATHAEPGGTLEARADLCARGRPAARSLAILEPSRNFRGQVQR